VIHPVANIKDLGRPMPFCLLCFRFMTPAEARKHGKHAAAIVKRKPKGK
jgi:hypothetical protein